VRADPVGARWAPARRPPRDSRPHEALDIKDLLGVQHVVEGAPQLVGQGRQRLGLAQLRRQALEQRGDALVGAALHTAASEKGHLSQALPAFLLPVPTRWPADSWAAPHRRA